MELVTNSELVTAIFGSWPSFHDATVSSITCKGPSNIYLGLEYAQMTGNMNGEHYELTPTYEIGFHLRDVKESRIEDWGPSNILFELLISKEEAGIRVVSDTCACAHFDITCTEVIVMHINHINEKK